MIIKNYQRKHLRAPFKEGLIYADGSYVLKASTLNLSEGGVLLDQVPVFPATDDVPLMFSIPQIPMLKNFTLLKMQTFNPDMFVKRVVRAKAKLVRREELSQNLDNIFRSRFGLQFVKISPIEQKYIEEYISTFSSNLIYLQTLIDSFNTDEETKSLTRTLAGVLGYTNTEKIAHLRMQVMTDYRSLQWL